MNSRISRSSIKVRGIVQGVGFRPFVYNLAKRYGLNGWVCNSSGGVVIEVEGHGGNLKRFVKEFAQRPPVLAQIENIEVQDNLALQGYEKIGRAHV